MVCFHGTTRENCSKILSGSDKKTATWKVSAGDNLLYVLPVGSGSGIRGLLPRDEAFDAALGGGMTTASLVKGATTVVVMEFDIPSELLEWDHSCDFPEARAIPANIAWNYIKYLHVHEYTEEQMIGRLARNLEHPLINIKAASGGRLQEAREITFSQRHALQCQMSFVLPEVEKCHVRKSKRKRAKLREIRRAREESKKYSHELWWLS